MKTEFFIGMLEQNGSLAGRFDVDGDQDCAEAQLAAFSPPSNTRVLRLIRRTAGWAGSEVAVRAVRLSEG